MENQRSDNLGYYTEDYVDSEELELMEDDLDDDEGIEAYSEDDLDDDESFDAEYDDDDESIEAYQEDDLDDDESYVVEDDDDDEAFEDDDDEAFDEGYADMGEADEAFAAERSRRYNARRRAWAARRRAMLAKRRARQMRMRARAAQKKVSHNVRRTQQQLNKKLRAVRSRGPLSVPKFNKARGTGYVTAVLQNGRRAKMAFIPALATRTDVNHLTRQLSAIGVKQAKAIQTQAKNIKLLKSAQGSAIKSITAQQLKNTKLLTKQITDGDKNLDKRITKLVTNQKKLGRKQDAKMLGKVKEQQRRSTWNSVLIASSIPLFAAYGDRAVGDNANPFTKKNLIIGGSTAGWLFADDIVARFLKQGGKKWHIAGNVWNIAAPILNWATVYYFMKDKQHQRFVTGLATVEVKADGTHSKTVEVLKYIGEDSQSDFKKIDAPRVVATIQSQDDAVKAIGVEAKIDDNNQLQLTLIGIGTEAVANEAGVITTPATTGLGLGNANIYWQLDTMDPNDQRSSSSTS